MPLSDAAIVPLKRIASPPETMELGLRFFREAVGDCCAAVAGFLGGWVLVDREHSRTVTLTAWTEREPLDAARPKPAAGVEADPDAADMVRQVNAGGVEFETYEVEARPRAAVP